MIPTELRESMTRTIDAVIEFILDALDSSPEETVPPKEEADLKRLSLPLGRETPLATVLWNDEKHSFVEVASALQELIGCTHKEGMRLAELIDNEVREDRMRLHLVCHLLNSKIGPNYYIYIQRHGASASYCKTSIPDRPRSHSS